MTTTVINILGYEFELRSPFYLKVSTEGKVEKVTINHVFVNFSRVARFNTIHMLLPTIQENAQECADRAQGRGFDLSQFKVKVIQTVVQDSWAFEFNLVFQNGEEYDDSSAETLPEWDGE